MTVKDLKIGVNHDKSARRPISYGSLAGLPSVGIRLSISENKKTEVPNFQRKMENWNWTKGLSSGFSRLRFSNNPFHEDNAESISELSRLLNARFVDVILSENEITEKPPRNLDRAVDFYSIFVPLDEDFDEEVFEYFVRKSRDYGDCEFIFKVKSNYDEQNIRKFSTDWGIYDSDIWLYPNSRKITTLPEKMRICNRIAMRNSWNVSPRMDLVSEADEEVFE